MKTAFLFIITAFLISCKGETKAEKTNLKPASSYFPSQKTKVLVVGTFHFDFPGLDEHKTGEEDKIDVLLEPKQSEVLELAAYIKKFKPNKIAIEAGPGWEATKKLREYKEGSRQLGRSEVDQLGIRIAADLELDTLYALNAPSFAEVIETVNDSLSEVLWKDYDWKSDDPLDSMYRRMYEDNDKAMRSTTLLDYFTYLNSKEYHQYDYGAYLIGDFRLDEYRGADVLSVYWYNRNLRIFRKLQDITESEEDRILLIFGNGHASLLRQFLESSPEYEFVEFDSL